MLKHIKNTITYLIPVLQVIEQKFNEKIISLAQSSRTSFHSFLATTISANFVMNRLRFWTKYRI